jgi:tRNA-specific 2-thiouridylase
VHRFTVGQRKGLGVSVGTPAYVTSLDAANGTVRLGDRAALLVAEAEVEEMVFADGAPDSLFANVKIRAHHSGADAWVERTGAATAKIRFQSPVASVVVGQFAVVYEGDNVRGGGRIARVHGAST